MTKIKLFTAVQISRQIANKANLEAKYYEYLKKADNQFTKPNNALLSIVNALNRLIKSAEALGKDIPTAFAEGYFDNTLDEYKKHTGSKSFEYAKEKLDKEKQSVLSSLEVLGKPLDKISEYFDNRLKYDVLPMQAFEMICSNVGLIEGTVFGTEHYRIAMREYNISKALRMFNSAVAVVKSPEKTEKQKQSANLKIDQARTVFASYSLSAKLIDGKTVLIESNIVKAKPEVQKAKAKSKKEKRETVAVL